MAASMVAGLGPLAAAAAAARPPARSATWSAGPGGATILGPGPGADLWSGREGGWPGATGRPGGEARRSAPRRGRHPARRGPSWLPCGRRAWPARYEPAAGGASPEGAHARGRSPPALDAVVVPQRAIAEA